MKKLYLQEKMFSWVEKFAVKDETGRDCYLVHGDNIVIGGKKLHIEDMQGREVAMVRHKLLSLYAKFFVFVNGQHVAEIVKKFAMLKAKYAIKGPGWEATGSFFDHDYTISDGGRTVAKLHKAWMSWGDSFELEIADSSDEVLVLATVLAIESIMQAQRRGAAISMVTNSN